MTISSHIAALNDRLTRIETVAERAPERTFETAKNIADAVAAASNGVRRALADRGMVALNDDRLRELEAAIFGYLMRGNPAFADEVAAAEGFADALDGPAGAHVMAQLLRDRDFLDGIRGSEAPAAEIPPATEAVLLGHARYVLLNLDVERPGAGYGKLAAACGRAAGRAREAADDPGPDGESAPRL